MTKLIGLTGAYDFLERMILEPAGARYNPDWKKARENLENSHDENLDYLGTYFPRTVLESAIIFEHLMRTMPSVKKMLAERDVIRVLDFGCGTGGELLGFLIALGWEFNWELPAVEVDAIDGNEDALGMMQDIMHLCRDKWDFDLRVRTVTHKAEKSGFAPANVKLRDDYDVLVTSKCLGELNAVSQTLFLDFVCEFFDSIAPEGLIVMMDVTSRQPHNRGNDWTNLQMTGEFDTHRLQFRKHGFRTLFPLVCDGCSGCRSHSRFLQFIFDFSELGLLEYSETKLACRAYCRDKLWQKCVQKCRPPDGRYPWAYPVGSAGRKVRVRTWPNFPAAASITSTLPGEADMPMEIQTPEGRVKAMTPVILSASRSTDIPAYYGQWFMNRLRAGWCAWVNPFNRRPSYVSFRDVKAVVFWTKNPAPFLQHLDELDVRGLHYYFQYTLNDYEREGFEPNVPALEKRIETFRRLSERIGPDRVVWRFDPIILSPGTGPRDILMRIWTIGKALRGLTKKLVVSFVDVGAYRKVQANLVRDTGLYTRETVLSAEPDEAQRREICEGLAKIRERWHSEGWDIEISSCAEEADLAAWGITYNRCIDGELMERVFGEDKALVHFLHSGKLPEAPAAGADSLFGDPVIPVVPVSKRRNLKDKGQREACGCIVSKDIGMYDTCMHFCAYCYANASRKTVLENRRRHDPESPFLAGEPGKTNEDAKAENTENGGGR